MHQSIDKDQQVAIMPKDLIQKANEMALNHHRFKYHGELLVELFVYYLTMQLYNS